MIKIKSSEKLRKIEFLPREIQRMVAEFSKMIEMARGPNIKKTVVVVIERKKDMKRLKKMALKRESAISDIARGLVPECNMKYLRFTIKTDDVMYGIFYAAPIAKRIGAL